MPEKSKGKPWNLIIGGIFIVALFGAWFALPMDEWLKTFSHWIEGLGVWGYVLFIGVYVLACLILAPGTPLTIAAGLIFGLVRGFVVVLVGATIGASLAFLVARYLLREKVRISLEGKPKLAAVEKAISEDGWKSSCAAAPLAARAVQPAELFLRRHRSGSGNMPPQHSSELCRVAYSICTLAQPATRLAVASGARRSGASLVPGLSRP